MAEKKEPLLGAVDLGSNSFRVEIGRLVAGQILTESYWKETVRLAAGFDDEGYLTPQAQQRALEALARFKEKLAGVNPKYIRAVGTQALRIAKNSAEFLPKAEAALGHPIEIIAGREEARLVFAGCAHTLPPSPEKRLVVDIGGASTELIIGSGTEAHCCESFHVGCVNTSVTFFKDGKLTARAFKSAQLAAGESYKEAKRRATEALTHCHIADLADYPPQELSYGQRQIACLARAVVNSPKLILADEAAALILGAVILLLCVLVIMSSIRMTTRAQNEEIRALNTFGAEVGFIAAPYGWRGAITLTAAALVSIGISWLGVGILAQPVTQFAAIYNVSVTLSLLRPDYLVIYVVVCAVLGYVSGLSAASSEIRKVQNEQTF